MSDEIKTTGYVIDCYLVARNGDILFNEAGQPTMRGYAIVPLEEYGVFLHFRNARQIATEKGFLPELPKPGAQNAIRSRS